MDTCEPVNQLHQQCSPEAASGVALEKVLQETDEDITDKAYR